jgi:hypothetical protein
MPVSHYMSQPRSRRRQRHLPLGMHLIAGAVGVLAGLQYLLSSRGKIPAPVNPVQPRPVPARSVPEAAGRDRDFFSIRRTKSEFGYVYWVLQGFGEFQCFVLYDTWREAMDEAYRRVSEHRLKSVPLLVGAVTA